VSGKGRETHRRAPKPTTPDQSEQTTLPLRPPDKTTLALLPMEIRIGNRLMDQDLEWEVVSRPVLLHGGKSLRVRIRRPGLPESEREVIWPAHIEVEIQCPRP
jgi:hypothetical protein